MDGLYPGLARCRRVLVVLVLLAVLAAGCGTPMPPTPTPEPVKIRFAFSAEQADYYDPLIQEFNGEHPEVTVERRTVRTGETWHYLFDEKQIDAFAFSTESSLFTDVWGEEGILDLTPLIQQSDAPDLDDFYPSVLEPFTLEGSVWAVPVGVNLGVLYYNKDLFGQYDVFYPKPGWTWDDLLETALQVRDPDNDIYGLAAFPFFSIPFIYQHGGGIVDDWRMPTRMTLDDPLTVEAVDWFAALAYDYDVMPSPEAASKLFGQDGSAAYVFWRRKAGMYMGWLSDRGGVAWGPQARWQMQWGMVPLPHDEHAATLGMAYGHAIAADTAYPEACWKWLMFLNEQMPPYTMPARQSLAESDAWEEMVGAEVASAALASIDGALIVYDSRADIDFDMDAYMEALAEILNGNTSAMEALSELQRQADSR